MHLVRANGFLLLLGGMLFIFILVIYYTTERNLIYREFKEKKVRRRPELEPLTAEDLAAYEKRRKENQQDLLPWMKLVS